jgi:hypothetical protein
MRSPSAQTGNKTSTEKHLHLASWMMSVVVVRRHRLAGILLDSVVALHPSSDYIAVMSEGNYIPVPVDKRGGGGFKIYA